MITDIEISNAWEVHENHCDSDGVFKDGIFLNTGLGTWTQNVGRGKYKKMINGNYGVIVYTDGSIKCIFSKSTNEPKILYDYLKDMSEQERIEYAEVTFKSLKGLEKYKL